MNGLTTMEKLEILSAAAKYDVACTSSGADRKGKNGSLGNTTACGICHSFAADGRCISLLKILLSNACIYDCQYCNNRVSNDTPRATFTNEEVVELTMNFYKRNYIEGLFLSSGVIKNPNYTAERLYEILFSLRHEHNFNGYIHIKGIPGADPALIEKIGMLADRMSVNIELPSEKSLNILAPDKPKASILLPMGQIRNQIIENKHDLIVYKHAPKFVPAGQSTQMIVGATPDTDKQIISLSEGLYQKYKLKRVFYSAYIPVGTNPLLPVATTPVPLLREHRLYQADWLLRFYGFSASELLDDENSNFNNMLDPKCDWALRHMDIYPVEVNKAPYETLLRVPGIGVTSAKRIVMARRHSSLDFLDLRKLGIVLKRAQFFITCKGKVTPNVKINPNFALRNLMADKSALPNLGYANPQTSIFDVKPQDLLPSGEDELKCLTGQI